MSRPTGIVSEAALAGAIIAAFYLAIFSYQMSWQAQFGFEYINLSPEELAYSGRHLILPLGLSAAVYVTLRHYLLDDFRWGPLVSGAILAPLTVLFIYLVHSATLTEDAAIGTATFMIFYFYVLMVMRGSEAGFLNFTNNGDHSLLQFGLLVGLAGCVVFAFGDVGRKHAQSSHQFELLQDKGRNAVILVRDEDRLMAAILDEKERKISQSFLWIKLDKDPILTRSVDLLNKNFWETLHQPDARSAPP